MNLPVIVSIVIRTSIVLTVLSVGLSATPAQALSVLRSPIRLAQSIGTMMLVVPLFTAILASALELQPDAQFALVALSVSPVPPFWPAKSKRGGGDESYTVGVLVASALLSVVTIPIVLGAFGVFFSVNIAVPLTTIARVTSATVLLPLLIGMTIRALAWGLAYRAARPVGYAGTALLALSVLLILARAWPSMAALFGDGTMLTLGAFTTIGLVAGHVFGGPADEERTTLALACSTRHPAIALSIALANYPSSPRVAPTILLYVLVSGAVSAAYLQWVRRRSRPRHHRLSVLR